MGKADLHIHSEHSDGMASIREILEFVETKTDLDLIAITDHDMFDGAREALELVARKNYRFDILPGMEVTTLEGHLLALGISTPIKSLQRLDRSIAQIHAQGGVAIIPHPMSWLIRSVGQRGILRIQNDTAPEVYFDGIEALNPSIAGQVTVAKTKRLNELLFHLPETGGSDAHTLSMIGTGVTYFQGSAAAHFLQSLRAGQTRADGHFWTRQEVRELARIAPQQSYRALVKLPTKHLRRLLSRHA
ncbi:MAG: PHP domain-containing protein [Chloroflexi bacterium]|nr:PHP domain-containing protein [Chloroflexota bacterium]